MGPRLQRPSHRRRDKVAGGRGRIRQHGLGGIVDVDGCASASDSGSSSSPSGRAVRSWLQIGILGFASVSVGEGFNRLLDTIRPPPEWRGRIPGLQVPLWVQVTPDQAHPSKSRLMTVQDFFKYTNLEGQWHHPLISVVVKNDPDAMPSPGPSHQMQNTHLTVVFFPGFGISGFLVVRGRTPADHLNAQTNGT